MTAKDQRAVLEAERDRWLGALRDLDAEWQAGHLEEDDYLLERDRCTSRAAEVLRRLESARAGPGPTTSETSSSTQPAPSGAPPAAAGAATGPGRRPRRRRGGTRARWAVAGAGVILLGLGLYLLVSGHTAQRQTGQALSGSVPLSPAQELAAAQTAMARGQDVTALELYQSVLHVEPNQPQALAYSGWLLRIAGDDQEQPSLVVEGVEQEEAAVKADPSYPDARYFLGIMLLDEGHDPAGAVTQLEAYLATDPPAPVARAVRPILARARQEAAAHG
jgi:tetratricopeptide (TPR) repeat protein